MDNKVQNIILIVSTAVIIIIGLFFTLKVMSDDNPREMSYEQQEQWAINDAIEKGLDKKMTSSELSVFKSERTIEIANEKYGHLNSDVKMLINYTFIILLLACVFVVGGFVYLAMIDKMKALKILAGVGVFLLLMLIVWWSSSSEVPANLVDSEVGLPDEERIYNSTNWKLASASITATGILIIVALLGWVGGSIAKIFR